MKFKKILSFLSVISLSSTIACFSSSCSSKDSIPDQIINADHSWEDVEMLKNQIVNGTERKAGIDFRASKSLQKAYLYEEEYKKEKRELAQSNIELELDEMKLSQNPSSNDAYNMLEENAEEGEIKGFDWTLIYRYMDDTKNQIYQNINSIKNITEKDKAELYNDVDKELNIILFDAKNQQLDYDGTIEYIDQQTHIYVVEKLHNKSKKMIASNLLQDYVSSTDFKINEQLLDSDTVSFKKWEEASTEQRKNIETQMVPLLFTYQKLPIDSQTAIDDYVFGFSINKIEWETLFDASVSITFHLWDEHNELLASTNFDDIKVQDNFLGKKQSVSSYINALSLKEIEEPAEYTAFKNTIEGLNVKFDNKYFIDNEKLTSIADYEIDKQKLSDEQIEAFNKLLTEGKVNVGGLVNFTDDPEHNSGTLHINICLYTKLESYKNIQIYETQQDVFDILLQNTKDELTKSVSLDEMAMGSIVETTNHTLTAYDYYSDDKQLDTINSYKKRTSDLNKLAISYLAINSVSTLANTIIDAVTGNTLFALVDVVMFAAETYAMIFTYEKIKDFKKAATDQHDDFISVRNSDDYQDLKANVAKNNIYQVRRELEDEFLDTTTPDEHVNGVDIPLSPEELISRFEKKYSLTRKDAVKKVTEKENNIAKIAITTFANALPALSNGLRQLAFSSSVSAAVKALKVSDYATNYAHRLALLVPTTAKAPTRFMSFSGIQSLDFTSSVQIWDNTFGGFDVDNYVSAITKDLEDLTAHNVSTHKIGFDLESIKTADPIQKAHLKRDVIYGRISDADASLENIFIFRNDVKAGHNPFSDQNFLQTWKDTAKEQIDRQLQTIVGKTSVVREADITYTELIEQHFTHTRDYLTKEIDNIFDNVIPNLSEGDKLLLTKEIEIKAASCNFERSVKAAAEGTFSPVANVALGDRIRHLPVRQDMQGNVQILTGNYEAFGNEYSRQAYLNSIDSASVTHSKFMEYKLKTESSAQDFMVKYEHDKLLKKYTPIDVEPLNETILSKAISPEEKARIIGESTDILSQKVNAKDTIQDVYDFPLTYEQDIKQVKDAADKVYTTVTVVTTIVSSLIGIMKEVMDVLLDRLQIAPIV